MARGKKVPGWCYATRQALELTPAEWRAKYPPSTYERATTGAKGETWYRTKVVGAGTGTLAAEAYGIIPAGKP